MHAMAATAATSRAMLDGDLVERDLDLKMIGPNSLDALTYKMETARLINERLSDPQEAASDAMIAAVAILASSEVRNSFF